MQRLDNKRTNLSRTCTPRCYLLAFVAMILALGPGATPALATEPCPNEQLRAESNSSGLPSCRAYELVSPANAGGPVETQSLADNGTSHSHSASNVLEPDLLTGGNLVAQLEGPLDVQGAGSTVFWSSEATPPGTGAIEDGGGSEPFRSVRTSGGWTSESVLPRAPVNSKGITKELLGASTDGSTALIATNTPLPSNASAFANPEQAEAGEWNGVFFYLVSADGSTPRLITHGELRLPENAELLGGVETTPFAAVSASPDLSEIAFTSIFPLATSDVCGPTGAEFSRHAPTRFGTTYLWNANSLNGRANQLVENGKCTKGSPNVANVPTILPDGGSVVIPGSGAAGSMTGPLVERNPIPTINNAQIALAGLSGGTLLSTTPDGAIAYVLTEANIYAVDTSTGWNGTKVCISCGTDQAEVTYLTISQDGAHILFTTNEGLWEWSEASGAQRLTPTTGLTLGDVLISTNGRFVVVRTSVAIFSSDTNGTPDLYELSGGKPPILITSGSSADNYALHAQEFATQPVGESEAPLILEPAAGGVSDSGARVVYEREPARGAPAVIDEWTGGQTTQISPVGSRHGYQVAAVAGEELEDIFFLAEDPIVSWDENGGVPDVYDARISGGFPPCTEGNPTPPVGAANCATPSGTPNPVPPAISVYTPDLSPTSAPLAPLASDTSRPASSQSAKPLTRAQKLRAALTQCKKHTSKAKRKSCETAAHKKYGPESKATKKAKK
jgi:hypothetical protein